MITTQDLQTLIAERGWKPGLGMSAFDSAANYRGVDLSDWVVGFGQNRDSELLTQSNFAASLDELGGEQDGIVEVVRIGHWACGWVEQIHVHKSATDKLIMLLAQIGRYHNYPVLDDSDYSEREMEYQNETLDQHKSTWSENLAKFLGVESDTLDSDQTELVLYILYHYECGYCGTEDAYLETEDFARLAKSSRYELTEAIRNGNKVARAVLRKAGVRMIPKRRA